MGQKVTDPALLAALNAQETPAPAVKAPIDPAVLAQLNSDAPPETPNTWGQAVKNVAGTGWNMAKGAVGGLAGDVAGLAAIAANLYQPDTGTPLIDPAKAQSAVSGAVQDAGGDVGGDPNSATQKVVEAIPKGLNWLGDKAVQVTGTQDDPVIKDIVHAAPLAIASLAGVRGPQGPLKAASLPTKILKDATPEALRENAVKVLLKDNVRLTTEQRGIGMGAKQAGSLGRVADTLLGKSKLAREQLQDFTRAVLDKVGITAKNVTPDAMAELKDSVTRNYNAAHAGLHVNIDSALVNDINSIGAAARRNPVVESRFDKMLEHIKASSEPTPQGPRISAKNAEEIRHELGNIEGSADSNIKSVARDIKDALDAATGRSATPAQLAALKGARGQYHFMRQIEDAIDSKSGAISPKKLLNVINRKRNKNEAVYGKGDQSLADLARAGAEVLPEAVGDSGTASRTMDIAKGVLALGHPVTAAKAAGAVLGGRLLNEASATRGTTAGIAAENLRRAQGANPVRVGAQQALVKETPDQKKRRLQAEALKGTQ